MGRHHPALTDPQHRPSETHTRLCRQSERWAECGASQVRAQGSFMEETQGALKNMKD